MFKRFLSLIISLALCFALAMPAFALDPFPYTDVAQDASYADALRELYRLGIMKGHDGKFEPDSTITREEFATVVCNLLGVSEEAKAITTCPFTDVKDTDWSVGYIAKAAELGIISGYGDGNFGPTDPVTLEQAAKMLVCALGREEDAIAAGGWPNGYMTVAASLGMVAGAAAADSSKDALRATVGTMAYNAASILFQAEPDPEPEPDPAPVSGQIYLIANKASGRKLDVYGQYNSSNNKANVHVYDKLDATSMRFAVNLTGDGWYVIVPQSNTSLVVNCYSYTPSNGTNVNAYTFTASDNTQGWYFEAVGEYYAIRSAYNKNLALTAEGTANLSNVKLATYTGSDLQLWKLEEEETKPGSDTDNDLNSLLFPVNNGCKIAYYFGKTPNYFEGKQQHNGIDIHASGSSGDYTIYAAAPGKVVKVTNSCTHSGYQCVHAADYGNHVQILGDDGRYYYYGHLKQNTIRVQVGQTVKAGDELATMGTSGWSTGVHLHFEVRQSNNKTAINVNPASGNYTYKGSTFTYRNGPYGTPYEGNDASLSGKTFVLTNKASGKALDVYGKDNSSTNNSNIHVYSVMNIKSMRFTATLTASNWYMLTPLSNSKLAVNCYSYTPSNGTNVNALTKTTGDKTQGWYLEAVGEYYVIRSAYNKNLVLTAEGTANLSNVKLATYTGSDFQLWKLTGV